MARSLFAIFGGAIGSAILSSFLFLVVGALMSDSGAIFSIPFLVAASMPGVFLLNTVGAIAFGLPWRWLAERNDWRAAWQYWAPAAICGFSVAFLFVNGGTLLSGDASNGWRWFGGLLPAYLFGAALGGFTAYFAWLIRRPDRDAPNPDTRSS